MSDFEVNAVGTAKRLSQLEDHFRFLNELIEERIVENDNPNCVKWQGVWYDGPLADAYYSTLRAIQKLAQAALEANK